MPRPENSDLNQKAVLWSSDDESTGTAEADHTDVEFDDYGQPKRNDPVEIDCRWKLERKEAITPSGQPIGLEATAVVDRDIAIGSTMWLGPMDDLPDPVKDLMKVVTFKKVPDTKSRRFRRKVGLMKASDALPEIIA